MVLGPLAGIGSAAAQSETSEDGLDDCEEQGYNVECNDFGAISMKTMRDVDGEPLTVTTTIQLDENYEDRDARWIMFSTRNHTQEGPSPVTIQLESFRTSSEDVLTSRISRDGPSELNLWVHVLDVPVDERITLETQVGVSERGAYALETIVIPFDRGYEPVKNASGETVSLFSSTLLAVNEPTGSTVSQEGSLLDTGNKTPALGVAGVLAAVGLGIAVVRRTGRR